MHPSGGAVRSDEPNCLEAPSVNTRLFEAGSSGHARFRPGPGTEPTCSWRRLCRGALAGSTGGGVRQVLGLAYSSIDQVEAEIPEAWVAEVEAHHLAERLWVA